MEEIRPGVWVIYGENRGRFPFAHSLYLEGEQRALIDTGAGQGLQQLVGKVDRVFLSHYHRDHVAANSLFAGASFSIHPLDEPGIASEEGFYRLAGTGLKELGQSYWDTLKQKGFDATVAAERHGDGDRIDLGGLTLQVIHTPGHTPGHCVFLVEEYELLFTADIDLTSFGPWYGNESSDPEQFAESVQRLRSLKARLAVTSHSRTVEDGLDEKLTRYGAVIEKRHELIYNLLRQRSMTLEQLTDLKPIFRRHPEPVSFYRFFEGMMIKKHLTVLRNRGAISCAGEGPLYQVCQA